MDVNTAILARAKTNESYTSIIKNVERSANDLAFSKLNYHIITKEANINTNNVPPNLENMVKLLHYINQPENKARILKQFQKHHD